MGLWHWLIRYVLRSDIWVQDTGLYYLQSRYYNPNIGRFINADIYISTGQGVLGNNMFAYCRNNPVCRKDASGTDDVTVYMDDGSDGTAYNEPIDPEDAHKSEGGGNVTGHRGCSNSWQGGKQGGSGLDRPASPRQISKSALKNVDVHAFKEVYVGKDGKSWDLYKDTANNAAIWLGNKAQTNWIPTGYILEELLEYFLKGWK